MKKAAILLLTLILCLALAVPAGAAAIDQIGHLALLANGETTYIGPSNHIYRSDSAMPLAQEHARSLVYADANLLLYTVVDELNQHDHPGSAELRLAHLTGGETSSSTLVHILGEAIYVALDASVYYRTIDSPDAVMRYSVYAGSTAQAFAAPSPIERLSASIDGLLIETADGVMLYSLAAGQALPAADQREGATIEAHDAYETLLDAKGDLSLRLRGDPDGAALRIDGAVLCATVMNGAVYYLKRQEDGAALYGYIPSRAQKELLRGFTGDLLPELAAGGGYLYVIDREGHIYRYSVGSGLTRLAGQAPSSAGSPLLVGTAEGLLLYDSATHDGAVGYVDFIALTGESGEVESAQPAPQTAPQAEKPKAEISLSRGSRGDEVQVVQRALKAHGYLSGKADGIYGANTQTAVKYLQFDLGLSQDGKVDQDLYDRLLADRGVPDYAKYVSMSRGDRGIRVTDLQQRLRALGYLEGKVDGVYGKATVAAVVEFEASAGLGTGGNATVSVQKKLFAKGAPPKPHTAADPDDAEPHANTAKQQYISDDDLIAMVRWMNNHFDTSSDKTKAISRLQKALYEAGYLKKKHHTKVYDEATFLAVKHFQNENDILPHPTGLPDSKTLAALFDA